MRGGGRVFCCPGCRDLYLVIGEERIAELRAGGGLDWAALRPAAEPAGPGGGSGEVRTLRLQLGGLWCASCAVLVEHVLSGRPGVVRARVEPGGAAADVAFDPALATPADLEGAVRRLGYAADGRTVAEREAASADLLRRLALAAVLALAVMMGSVPVWSGYLGALAPGPRAALGTALWALATPAVLWSGWPFLRGAWASVRHGRPTMDLLVAAGSLSAYGYSVWAVLAGAPRLYFDTSAMLVAFLLLGRTLEHGARQRTGGVARLLAELATPDADVLRAGREVRVPGAALREGDAVVIRPGQVLPCDGTVREGSSAVDEAALTGEAVPVARRPGDPVYAGTVALDGRLVVTVLRTGERSVLGQTAAAVRAALSAGGRWQRAADRYVRRLVPFVLVAGVATFAAWRLFGGLGTGPALLRGVAVLVIACPCALGVATPLAALAGAQRLGRAGVLLRQGDALERAAGVDTVLFDKTGTATTGRLALAAMAPDDAEALGLAAAAEAGSRHPLALAVVRAAEERGLDVPPAEGFSETPGEGVEARVGGRRVRVGACPDPADLPAAQAAAAAPWAAAGRTILAVEVDGRPRALLALEDRPRPEAAAAAGLLAGSGIEVWLVSGDAEAATAAAARALGIARWRARQTPAAKAELVARLRAGGRTVAFVGDGINDAAALVAADVGLALASGADIAVQAGHLTLLRPDLRAVGALLDIARRSRATIRRNLIWALAYNALALPAAALGWAQPVLAAAAMVASSAVVLGNSVRLLGRSPAGAWMPAALPAVLGLVLAALAWWRL